MAGIGKTPVASVGETSNFAQNQILPRLKKHLNKQGW